MKIIENTQFNRINLQFDEKPSKEILQKLKDEGWRYSPQHKLWYPSASAVENSRAFAESLQKDINNEASAYMESMQDAIDTNEPGFNSADERLSALVQNATDYEISPENTKVMVDNIKQQVINENESILEARLIQMEKLLLDMKAELQTTRERISKLENNNSNNNEITFPVVVLPQSSDFVESWSNNHNSVAKGLFIIKEDDKLVAIDNTDGECWVEDFDSLDKAVTYLTNSSFSPEEIRELNDADAHAAALNKLTEVDLVLINDNILNSNVFVTADIGNPVELALHNPKTGEYFLIQSIDDDDRWDYTLYDKDFKLIDGGQGVSGDITMPEDIRTAAQVVLKEFHPDDLSINDWVIRDYSDLSELINEIEAANYERVVDSIKQNWTEHDNGVEQARDERDSRDAQIKLNNIVTEIFLTLTDEEKENGTTLENKTIRYEKWYKPMVDEIMADIANGNKEALNIIQNFDLDPETHVQGNKWYTAIEAFNRDVQYKLLPELYEKVQDRIKAEYEEKKIPYVVMFSSESPKFPSENKVYTVTEFNEILMQADSEFHNRKKYAEQKYGSADNYWDLERDDKLPEEDKGIQFGYDKTNFKFFNIPNPRNPEDPFSYEPSRYDIGDGNGSIFDYVRATCSHDEFIEALNALETQLYFPDLDNNHKQIIDNIVSEEKKVLSEKVQEAMKELDEAQSEYKELHKKWLIESTEADRVDKKLKAAVDNIHQVYEDSVNNIYDNVFENIPPTDRSLSLETSTTLRYMSNEAKKLCIESLYQPSRDAQKAMNAEDYKTYNSVDWAKLRRIWEQFPANVNMSNWTNTLLEDKIKDLGIELESHVEKTPAQTVTEEEIQDIKIVDETSEIDIEPVKPLQVYTFSPFGYEGTVVQVETDLRPGIPAFDIVGLADSAVKETRERIQSAFRNSGLEFPAERVLQSLSPADLRKDAPMDLSMALGILGQTNKYPVTEPVLALGELELSGGIRPVRGAVAAVNTAKAAGIKNVVCDPTTAELLKNIDGIKILTAESLKEVNEKLLQPNVFQKTEPVIENTETVQFNEEDEWIKEALDNLQMDGHFETIRAIEIAVAGKHNILATGAPGCGKTLLTQTLMPALTPKLTEEEAKQITRINSLAGLDSPKRDNLIPPFRMPHQTATIEGMCGGGPNCRPGEVSLSHKGTLFLDETAEFRSSVIQLLRVPIESRSITLSRAGRSTTYPADFQLAMAMNPCPCGCFGSPDKICLDSARSIEQYWKKISDPLLDRVEIKTFVQKDVKDTRKISIEEMKAQIATAFEIQRKRGVYNSHMTPEDIQKYCKLDNESQAYLDKEEDKLTARKKSNLLKLSLTIANMAGREEIHINDIKEARELSAPVFEKPRQFVYDPEEQKKATVPQLDDVSITPEQIKDAENERKRITEPVLNGERTEMYTSFKNFEDKGVFEINGTHLNVSKNGGLTPTGWKQLQAAMEIYRSKKFETFRYIIINEKTGEIADQLAITSHMPNFCNVSKPNDETLKQVISRLEELGDDYKLAVCHNHPSGNTTESSFDRELTDSLDRFLRRSDGMNKFLGHIILDHDTFNLAVPSQNNPGKCHWKKMEPQIVNEVDRFTADPKPEWAGDYVGGTSALKAVAVKINDTENWNDDFIPVVFTNADRNISGVQYYSKNFFENESSQIRNEFQFAAMEAGAIVAFPVITDALWNKLGKESNDFEAVMKAHVLNDAFTDVAFNHTTMTEKYDIEAGRNYYNFYKDQSDRKIDVVSTWTPSINTRLFPPELENKKEQEIER